MEQFGDESLHFTDHGQGSGIYFKQAGMVMVIGHIFAGRFVNRRTPLRWICRAQCD